MSTRYGSMKDDSKNARSQSRQIIGISMSPALAREVKQEAARRGLSLRRMFEELWALYRAQSREPQK